MKIVLDACSLLNLANGEVLEIVCSHIPNCCAGPLVLGETKSISNRLTDLIAKGALQVLDDSVISASMFYGLQQKYKLGDGETECLAFALHDLSLIVSCDDRLAREMMTKEIGKTRRTGTVGLLLRVCRDKVLSPQQCFASYELMRAKGGFLPVLTVEEFEAALQTQ